MLSWLKKRSWKPEVLSQLQGNEGHLVIRLTNVPCLRDETTGDRKYAYVDFGHDFLMALHDAIGGAQQAHSCLTAGSTITKSIRLPQQPPIEVELSGKPNESLRLFESDVADALVKAFDVAKLRPK